MLYILRSYLKKGSLLKIGYAEDIKNRIQQYISHNPGVVFLGTREGDLIEEQRFHLYFHSFDYNAEKAEWYEDDEEIVRQFKTITKENIDTRLWEMRDDIFDSSILSGNYEEKFKFRIYKKLFDAVYRRPGELDIFEFERITSSPSKIDRQYFNKFLKSGANIKMEGDLVELYEEFNNFTTFPKKMEFLCLHLELVSAVEPEYNQYFYILGEKRVRACQFQRYLLDEELKNATKSRSIDDIIYGEFFVGDKITLKEIKSRLANIYNLLDRTDVAKASDISEWFDVQKCQVTVNGKRECALKLISKLKD